MLSFASSELGKGYVWNVDWKKFDQARVLSDVEANLEEITLDCLVGKLNEYGIDKLPIYDKLVSENFHGTILCISHLNDDWNDDALNGLLKNLEMLIPASYNHLLNCICTRCMICSGVERLIRWSMRIMTIKFLLSMKEDVKYR